MLLNQFVTYQTDEAVVYDAPIDEIKNKNFSFDLTWMILRIVIKPNLIPFN